MKRQILSLATALILTTGGAIFAQSTLNTTAPGPSQEGKPGQTNNNLQNPGSNNQKQTGTTTTTTTVAPTPSTATTTSTDMNNDSTTTSTGSMNNDSTMTPPPADTTTTTTTPSTYNSNSGTSGSSMDTTATAPTSLPKTASDMPTVALMGLLALSGFFGVRAYAKRNA